MEHHPPADAAVERLTDDLLVAVFLQLGEGSASALATASCVCKRWRDVIVVQDQQLWERLFRADFCCAAAPSRLSSSPLGTCALRVEPPSADSQVARFHRIVDPERSLSWRRLYERRLNVEKAWQGRPKAATAALPPLAPLYDGVLLNQGDFVRCLQLSGNTMVAASGSTMNRNVCVRVWRDVFSGGWGCRTMRWHKGPIWCMQYEPGAQTIATGSADRSVVYSSAATGNGLRLEDPCRAVSSLHMDAQGGWLASGEKGGEVRLFDLRRLNNRLQQLDEETGEREEEAEAERQDKEEAGVLQPCRGAQTGVLPGDTEVSCIQVDGRLLAVASSTPLSKIRIAEISEDGVPRTLRQLGDNAMVFAQCMSFDVQINRVVAGCADTHIRAWDLETGAPVMAGRASSDINTHQFDATMAACACMNGRVDFFDMRVGGRYMQLRRADGNLPIHAFQVDCGRSRVVTGDWGGVVACFDVRNTSAPVSCFKTLNHNERVWCLAMNELYVVSAGLDDNIFVRSLVSGYSPE